MKILVVSGYPAWKKVSKGLMPSHHLFGIHEMINHYEDNKESLRGFFKDEVFHEGYVDFYMWKSGKGNVLKQVYWLWKEGKKYDIVYDQLNRCSIFLGFLKKFGLFKTKLLTIMHHPPYDIQLKISDSDAYVFFNKDYLELAVKSCPKKKKRYFVNEWHPDYTWYENNRTEESVVESDAFFIDTGKSKRDKALLIKAAEVTNIRVDYAGDHNDENGFARSYLVDLKDDIGMIKKLEKYKAVVIPVKKMKKNKIGPLGITSYLDCLALDLPVIASDNVCFAEEIVRNKLGLIYKTGDLEDLKVRLKQLNSDFELYDTCKQNIARFTKASMLDYSIKLQEIITQLVNNK